MWFIIATGAPTIARWLRPVVKGAGASVTDRLVHLAAERVDLWVCRFASDGERGTWRTDLVTCPDCLAGRYSDGTPVRAAVARAARGGEP
jgi:hypothetical protein